MWLFIEAILFAEASVIPNFPFSELVEMTIFILNRHQISDSFSEILKNRNAG